MTVCIHAHQVPSDKRSVLKGKNLLPHGSKFFHFRVDPISEGNQKQF